MSKGKDMPVLVMDVEGTDGRERGEDQVSPAQPSVRGDGATLTACEVDL